MLSLIPAKYYYDDATQDQWQQQKKDKAETKQNKRLKLDPTSVFNADDYSNSNASAKDVMDNKALTGKKVVIPGTNFKIKKDTPKTEKIESEVEAGATDSENENSNDNKNSDSDDKSDSDESLLHENTQLEFDDDGNDINDKKKEIKKPTKEKKVISPEMQKLKQENLAKLREKLTAKITNLKEKRKAPGTKVAGAAQSRQQILEERKKKEELKRKRTKEMQEAEDDSASEDEDEDEDDEEATNNDTLLYGNIVFNDGSRVTSDLTNMRNTAERKKLKGPANNDIKAHLLKIEKKKRKLEQLSPEDQAKETEKSNWKKVLAQAEGIKVKDDEKLLKKALKRKEKQKLKSEIEWKDRKQIVRDTISAKLKRREENLKSRKDNKGKKSKNQPKLKKFTGIVNKTKTATKKRAGFEGSAKSKRNDKKK